MPRLLADRRRRPLMVPRELMHRGIVDGGLNSGFAHVLHNALPIGAGRQQHRHDVVQRKLRPGERQQDPRQVSGKSPDRRRSTARGVGSSGQGI